jgi:putative SOS response-associated peptidase YedK
VCGRYTLAGPDPSALRERFALGDRVAVRRRFNVAPGDDVVAVTTDREGAPRGDVLRWGLVPHWAPDPRRLGLKLINARAETVETNGAFRDAFQRRRCLVLADGFFEWERRPGAAKQPWWVTRADGEPFAFAGLWATWHGAEGAEPLRSCTIVTTRASAGLARVHDRMPVMLEREAEAAWVEPATPRAVLREVCVPLERTAMRAVGPAVNDARHDEPDCLASADPAAEPATLF